ncbi:response regulator transcription factor [Kribbella sp. NBC_01505]|uniref:response regulator n=1 Tax=Kribbella sp. NBC_01505 TaxID=2903580 RepID=UPI003870A3A0
MIRVLVADDQTLVRTGFRVILEAEGDIEVVAEADTGTAAIRQSQLVKPDVILMDIRMPELDGLSATEEIRRHPDPPTIIVLTTFDQNEYVYRALQAGAAGFLLKDSPATRLIAAVRAAATGDSLIEPAITRRLVEQFVAPATPQALPPELTALTDRELEVLRLIARGLSNAEIATELTVAETTVKTHVARVLTKLNVRDRVQAVVVAYKTGFAPRT